MPFSFSFFLFPFSFFFFLRFSSPFFVVLRVPLPCSFSFVLSFRLVVFRLFLVSPSSLLLSHPCFPWWRILLFCYFVSALHPPCAPCELEVRVLSPCMLSSCVLDVDLSLFLLLFLPFFDFDLDSVCFILSFSCGHYAVSSISVSAATRLAYDMYILRSIYVSRYVRALISPFIFVCGIRLVSVIVLLSPVFICFSPEVIFHYRVIGACPVTTDCIAAMT